MYLVANAHSLRVRDQPSSLDVDARDPGIHVKTVHVLLHLIRISSFSNGEMLQGGS